MDEERPVRSVRLFGDGRRKVAGDVGLLRQATLLCAALVLLLPIPARAQDEPTCFGRTATIYEPDEGLVQGTSRADVIVGGGDNSRIKARGGDDLVCQGDAEYLGEVRGGAGDDRITDQPGTSGLNQYYGGPGDDLLDVRAYNELYGGPGDDRLHGGYDQQGGAGDDLLVGKRELHDGVSMDAGPGDDVLDGRGTVATAVYGRAPGVRVDLAAGTATGWGRDSLLSIEHVAGSRLDDVLLGSDTIHDGEYSLGRSNDIYGGQGNDVIRGRGGADWVDAGAGEDAVDGGRGSDSLDAGDQTGRAANLLRGGPGDDRLSGGEGPDRIIGGPGSDNIHGHYGKNVVRGGDGEDFVSYGGRLETIHGGRGFDVVDFGVFGPVHVDLREQIARLGPDRIRMSSINGVYGSYYGDVLIGDGRRNLLFDGGNYSVDAQEDRLYAGTGDDLLFVSGDPFGDTEDELFLAVGGDGHDTLSFGAAHAGVTLDLAAGTASMSTGDGYVYEVEDVRGTRYADTLSGDEAANRLDALRGDDTLNGAGGDDTLDGGRGLDAVDGGEGTDACSGETEVACEEPVGALALRLPFLRYVLGS